MTGLPIAVPVAAAERESLPVPPRWFPAAALGAGATAAALAVDHRPGVGLTLSLAAVGAALLPAVRRALGPAQWCFAAVGAGLAVMPVLRDAEWLVALDLLAVVALGCLTLTGVRTWWSVVVGALSVPLRALHAPAFLTRPYAGTGLDRFRAPARAAGLTAGLLVVFGSLFASADRAFGVVLDAVVPDVTLALLPLRVVVMLLVAALTAGGLLAHLRPVAVPAPRAPERVRSTVEWVLPLAALDALFAVFVGVQAAVLFGGHEHVLRTAGLTYAEYARQGFFQLLAVVALTFAVVAGAVRIAPPGRLRRALLGVLCALAAVVLASALRRLGLYEAAYGLSRDRIVAHTVALWLGAVLALVVAAGGSRRVTRALPQLVVGSAAVALLGLNVANPDALVARDLVARWERTGRIDVTYLASLGADAAPALDRLPEPLRSCVLGTPADDSGGWPSYNVARDRAARLTVSSLPDSCAYAFG